MKKETFYCAARDNLSLRTLRSLVMVF